MKSYKFKYLLEYTIGFCRSYNMRLMMPKANLLKMCLLLWQLW